MNAWVLALACGLALAPPLTGAETGRRRAPFLNIDGVVNGASFAAAPDNFVAPNSIISIFGIDLSLQTKQVSQGDLVRGRLPLVLGGVQVRIGEIPAPLYFVSPQQINAQVPSEITPGEWQLVVVRENLSGGNAARVKVRTAAPGLFRYVTHTDYTLVGRGDPKGSTPARAGEVVILFATGLGATAPAVFAGELPDFAAPVVLPVRAWLEDAMLPDYLLLYVGQAPGFAGLYQINLELPADIAPGDPQVRIEIDGVKSQEGVRIVVGE
jgi:adhesin/invasin